MKKVFNTNGKLIYMDLGNRAMIFDYINWENGGLNENGDMLIIRKSDIWRFQENSFKVLWDSLRFVSVTWWVNVRFCRIGLNIVKEKQLSWVMVNIFAIDNGNK